MTLAVESMSLLRETGFLRALQPKKFGGLEVTLEEYGPCLVEIATACAATEPVVRLRAHSGDDRHQ